MAAFDSVWFTGAPVSAATSRTSFRPARTLTRPAMASTCEANCVWFNCRDFKVSRTSFSIAFWSAGAEAMMIYNMSVVLAGCRTWGIGFEDGDGDRDGDGVRSRE
jgi:hypothetical protein